MTKGEYINDDDEGLYFTYAPAFAGSPSFVIDVVINGAHHKVGFPLGEKQTKGFIADNKMPYVAYKSGLSLCDLKLLRQFLDDYISGLENKEE